MKIVKRHSFEKLVKPLWAYGVIALMRQCVMSISLDVNKITAGTAKTGENIYNRTRHILRWYGACLKSVNHGLRYYNGLETSRLLSRPRMYVQEAKCGRS